MLTPEKLREMGENTAYHSAATSQSSLIPSLNGRQPPLDDALSKQTAFSGVARKESPLLISQQVPAVKQEAGMCACQIASVMSNSATPWTLAHQAPLFMGFSRQEYWSGLPCPPPGDLSEPGIEPTSLMSPVEAGWFFTTNTTWEDEVGGLSHYSVLGPLIGTYLFH